MKYISKKAIVFCSCLMIMFSVLPTHASAQENVQASQSQEQIMPRADVLIVSLRTNSSGQVEKRRWNETRNCWHDPYWVLLSQPFPV